MPFTYSISEGIALGMISYAVINSLSGAAGKKKIGPLLYVLSILFVLKYVYDPAVRQDVCHNPSQACLWKGFDRYPDIGREPEASGS